MIWRLRLQFPRSNNLMDAALRFFVLTGLAALIIAANLSLIRLIATWWTGGSLAIGSFVVVQPPKDMDKLNEGLTQLLHAEFKNTVAQIKRIAIFANSRDALTISQPPIHSTDLSIKVGSVEVSGAISWLQSLFISERTLNFVVSFDGDKALVAGDISALSQRQPYLHFDIESPTPRKVSARLAYALYQAQMTEPDNSEATALSPADFGIVVETLAAVQELDRQARQRILIPPEQYASHLDNISNVTKKAPTWRGLKEAEAGLAFAARRYDIARQIYSEFLKLSDLSQGDRTRYLGQLERLKESSPGEVPAAILARRNIATLNENELSELRAGFKALYDDNSNNGYKFIAGLFPRYAQLQPDQPNNELMYLAWHRAYLAHFEAALRRSKPGVSLPYWDWTTSQTLPSAVLPGVDNPLAGGPLRLVSADGKVLQERPTRREATQMPHDLFPTSERVTQLVSTPNLGEFEKQIWQYHNYIHVALGGDLAQVETSAFDPLFWFLEANVDRLWTHWQEQHGAITVGDATLERKLEPFGKTVRDVIQTEKLGYKY